MVSMTGGQATQPETGTVGRCGKGVGLYRERYFDLNVSTCREASEEHQILLSYTFFKTALQTAGLVERYRKEEHITRSVSGNLYRE